MYIASSYTYLNKFEKSIEFYFKLLELESNKPCYYCNVFEMELLLNRPFTKSLEDEFIKKFRDNKESFILYSYLKILESIILGKEVFLEKWKATYNEVDFIRWEFETLENWMHSYKDEEIKVKLLEALKCFKREDNT